jgi:hypothetical protein
MKSEAHSGDIVNTLHMNKPALLRKGRLLSSDHISNLIVILL